MKPRSNRAFSLTLGPRWRSRSWRFLVLVSLACCVLIGLHSAPALQVVSPAAWAQTPPARLQRLNSSDIAELVYAEHPQLPLENTYIDVESGDVDEDSTLMSRFIRYHIYVMRRSARYRLDWKLTFADYLGAHEWVFAEQYPGADDLRTNPRDHDLEAIGKLNRAERDAVANTLVEIFSNENIRLPGFGI